MPHLVYSADVYTFFAVQFFLIFVRNGIVKRKK